MFIVHCLFRVHTWYKYNSKIMEGEFVYFLQNPHYCDYRTFWNHTVRLRWHLYFNFFLTRWWFSSTLHEPTKSICGQFCQKWSSRRTFVYHWSFQWGTPPKNWKYSWKPPNLILTLCHVKLASGMNIQIMYSVRNNLFECRSSSA